MRGRKKRKKNSTWCVGSKSSNTEHFKNASRGRSVIYVTHEATCGYKSHLQTNAIKARHLYANLLEEMSKAVVS